MQASHRMPSNNRPTPAPESAMETRLLTYLEFSNVHFYRFITLAFLLPACVLSVVNVSKTGRTDALVVCLGALILMARFSMEWLRVKKSEPAFLHEDELVVSNADGHRRIPLTSISSIRSKHSLFMVRRYRSWTDHLAFLEFTLNNGERVYTLAESAVFEFPAGKKSLTAMRAAVLAAKTKSIATRSPESVR